MRNKFEAYGALVRDQIALPEEVAQKINEDGDLRLDMGSRKELLADELSEGG